MKCSCPVCKNPVQWEGNLFRPFCSGRCKQIDLGHWAEGSYALPTNEVSSEVSDEVSDEAQTENQD